MTNSTLSFYFTIDKLVRSGVLDSPDAPAIVWQTCVRDVLADAVPSILPSYSISEGLRATPNELGPPERFELTRATFKRDGPAYSIAVEAQYEDVLPYSVPSSVERTVRPHDYGPAIVVYQLFGDVSPDTSSIRADIRAFQGSLEEFSPPDA